MKEIAVTFAISVPIVSANIRGSLSHKFSLLVTHRRCFLCIQFKLNRKRNFDGSVKAIRVVSPNVARIIPFRGTRYILGEFSLLKRILCKLLVIYWFNFCMHLHDPLLRSFDSFQSANSTAWNGPGLHLSEFRL